MTGRTSRLAALAATLTVTLVCALPSAHAAAPPTPITGFADVHVHQFANLGFGGLVVWGQSFTPDNSIETALPWDDWTPGHFGEVVDKNGAPVGMTSCPNLLFPSKCVRRSEVLGADCAPGTGGDIFHAWTASLFTARAGWVISSTPSPTARSVTPSAAIPSSTAGRATTM